MGVALTEGGGADAGEIEPNKIWRRRIDYDVRGSIASESAGFGLQGGDRSVERCGACVAGVARRWNG